MKCIYKNLYNTTHSGDFVGQDEGNLFNGMVFFLIVSLKKSASIVIRSLPETKITGEWLKSLWNQQVYTWFSRSWIWSSCCYYRWPFFKCQCVYTAARNIRWWQHNAHQAPRICWFCDKRFSSIFWCNPYIQKHQKQSAKSKEIVSVISIWSVSWRNPCSRGLHIMTYISWSAWKKRKSSGSSKKSTQNNVPGNASW